MYILFDQYCHTSRQQRINVTEKMLKAMNECYHKDVNDARDLTESDIKTALMIDNRMLDEDVMRSVRYYDGSNIQLKDWIIEWIKDYGSGEYGEAWDWYDSEACEERLDWSEEK